MTEMMAQSSKSIKIEDQLNKFTSKLKNMFKVNIRSLKSIPHDSIVSVSATFLNQKMRETSFANKKVLILEDCTSIEHFLEVMSDESLKKLITKSAHCFVIFAEVRKEGITELSQFVNKFPLADYTNRPLIIQLAVLGTGKSKIFYKSHEDDELKTFALSTEKLTNKVLNEKGFNFNLMLELLHSGIAGSFDDQCLMTCQVEVTKLFSGMTLIDYAVRDNDSLAIIFLKLFGETEMSTLESAVKSSSPEVIAALLELPINCEENEFENLQRTIQDKFDVESLICIAAEHGKPEVLELLLRLSSREFLTSFQEASECALKGKKWKNLKTLIKNDFAFPKQISGVLNATTTDDKEVEEVINLCHERKAFHEALRKDDHAVVEKFIENNPGIKIGFSLENNSSLAIALKANKRSDNFDMYALLLYNRFIAPNDAVHDGFYKSLSDDDKYKITIACQKYYGRPVDSHVFFIYSKTRLGFRYDPARQSQYFEKIKGYLDELNKIDKIIPILKVIENSETLSVVFDFDNFAAHKVDLLSNSSTAGICYFNSGRIYIGAKTSDKEVLGTLAHELTHYAMNILYDNKCEPFDGNDEARRQEFDAIILEYKSATGHHQIIKMIFDLYPERNFNSELIARVPQMIAHYRDSKFEMAEHNQKYKRLFDLYAKVLENIESFVRDPVKFHQVRKVQQINDKLNNLHEAAALRNSKIVDEGVLNSSTKVTQLLICEVPRLAVTSIKQSLQKHKSDSEIKGSHVFATAKDFLNEYFIQSFYSLISTSRDFMTFVVSFDEFDEDQKHDELWKFVTSESFKAKIILICGKNLLELLKANLETLEIDEQAVEYNWNDFSDGLMQKLLERKVSFQDFPIKLNKLVTESSTSLSKLQLKTLFSKDVISIGPSLTVNKGYEPSFYIEMSFFKRPDSRDQPINGNEMKWETDELINFTNDMKVVLITDEPGKGKSRSLKQISLKIKEKFPDRLVVRIDLHRHTEAFKSRYENTIDIILKAFAKPDNDFEEILFRELFKQGKVVLLLDGVDEIAPYFKHQFLTLVRQLVSSPVAQVWITTRPYLLKELKDELNVEPFAIHPFNDDDQMKFFVKFWRKQLELPKCLELFQKLELYATIVLDKLKRSLGERSVMLIGIPLQTRMVAEIFQTEIKSFLSTDTLEKASFDVPKLNIMWLYRNFISRKIQIVQSGKGKIVSREKADQEIDGINMIFLHEQFALKEIMGKEFACDVDKDKLQRYGIIIFDGDKAIFQHRTFSEYFVVTNVIKKLPKYDEEILYKIIFDSYNFENLVNLISEDIESSDRYQDESLQKVLAEFIERKAFQNIPDDLFFLHRLLYRYHTTMPLFLLSCIKHCSEKLIGNVLSCIVKEGYTIFMLATLCSTVDVVKAIWELEKLILFPEEMSFLRCDSKRLNAFQMAFLSFPAGKSDPNAMLKLLYERAKGILTDEERSLLITDCSAKKIELKYQPRSIEAFREAMTLKYEIAKEFAAETTECEIVTRRNLFTLAILHVIIGSDDNRKEYLVELFRWAKLQFSEECFKAFCENFYEGIAMHLENPHTQETLWMITKNASKDND